MFHGFPKLREIHICEKVIKGDEDPFEETAEDYAARLGQINVKLEKVVVIKHVITVRRGIMGAVKCEETKSVYTIVR